MGLLLDPAARLATAWKRKRADAAKATKGIGLETARQIFGGGVVDFCGRGAVLNGQKRRRRISDCYTRKRATTGRDGAQL